MDSILAGSADLTLDGNNAGTPGLFAFNGTNTYSGTFLATRNAIVDFDQSYSSASLNLATGTQLKLDGSVTLTFMNVTFGATALAAGTYSFAALNSAYDAFIVDGGSGSLIVGGSAIPEPSSAALLLGLVFAGFAVVRRPGKRG